MFSDQKKLLDVAFGKTKPSCDGQKVYKHLVYKVFFDALSSAYPLFYEKVDKKKFEEVIYDFMSYGAKSRQMWKMPNEFRKFVKKRGSFKEIPYVDDLLWFEWIDVKFMMINHKREKQKKFSFKRSYILSKSCEIKKLKYRVFEKENFDTKGLFYLLAYYNTDEYRTLYIEISEIMYIFLKKLKTKGLNRAIEFIVLETGQSTKEVKSFFNETLIELAKKGIIEHQ